MPIRRSFVQGAFVGGLFTLLGLGAGAGIVALAGGPAPQVAAAPVQVLPAKEPKRTSNVHRMACRDCVNLVVTEPKSAHPLGPNLLMLSVDSLSGGAVVVHIGQESHMLNIGQYADLTFEKGCRIALSRSEKGRAEFMFACDKSNHRITTFECFYIFDERFVHNN